MEEEQKPNEEVTEDVVENVEKSEGDVDGKVADRPEINYQRELERKNAALERARQELEAERSRGGKRDPNDISTWQDHELKLLLNDKNAVNYHEQANDILLERKVNRIREKERMQERRTLADIEIRTKYPEALDPTSELSTRIEQIMYENDLQKSPSGRLVAAKLAAAELGQTYRKSTEKERKAEANRVARVKGQMVDGDRSKPAEGDHSPKKIQELETRLQKESVTEASSVGEILDMRGTREKWAKFWGH
jgi:hypothetical protein